MADIQHASLTDEFLHEAKGAATASSGQVLTATGVGTATFQDINFPAAPEWPLAITDSLRSFSTVAQTLTTEGDELQVAYGAAETSPGGSISIAADGTVTFNQDGVYHLSGFVTASRTTNGGVAELAFAPRYNGTQVGCTEIVHLDESDQFIGSLNDSGMVQATAGDVISYHMLLVDDPGGTVGIYPTSVGGAVGWTDAPSSCVTVTKLETVES